MNELDKKKEGKEEIECFTESLTERTVLRVQAQR